MSKSDRSRYLPALCGAKGGDAFGLALEGEEGEEGAESRVWNAGKRGGGSPGAACRGVAVPGEPLPEGRVGEAVMEAIVGECDNGLDRDRSLMPWTDAETVVTEAERCAGPVGVDGVSEESFADGW